MQLDSGIVRILENERKWTVGIGFLALPNHIVTCSHIVNQALGRADDKTEVPNQNLVFDFPLANQDSICSGKVVHWYPPEMEGGKSKIEDLAIIKSQLSDLTYRTEFTKVYSVASRIDY